MRSSSGAISIAASAQRLDVDNRISLKYYYRIADNLLRQANIYREERNIIDLYIMLLRFSSLITETIPRHRDYQTSFLGEKQTFKKKLLNALTELEELKPNVQHRVEELNRKSRNQFNKWGQAYHQDNSLEWPLVKQNNVETYENRQLQVSHSFGQEARNAFLRDPQIHQYKNSLPSLTGEKFRKLSLSLPRAKEETLSRHSILGPHGLHGQWQPLNLSRKVQYPSNLDLTPIEIPCLLQSKQDGPLALKDSSSSNTEKSAVELVLSLQDGMLSQPAEEPSSMVTSDPAEISVKLDIIRQPSPPPVLANVQDLIATPSLQVDPPIREANSLPDDLICSESPLEVHISSHMMESFMRLAKSNTETNLETCGVLAGSLKNRKFYITALIIPKQESTSNTCQTTNEEEIFEYQDKQSLFPLGWIHTHPTQSCFMSSVDVHTHYSYQIMLPEAIAIVMAPRDQSRTHGIFRLTAPGGMSVIRNCHQRGFHAHDQPLDGGSIYTHCSDVFVNPKLKFDVVDFR